jgi:hypothetical protein
MNQNKTFWYYFIFGAFIILLVWAVILIQYPKRIITLCDNSTINGWPLNINTWEYNNNHLIIYIIWTLCFIVFIYGCINAEYNIIDTFKTKPTLLNYNYILETVEIYRFVFVSIFKFIIISYPLYHFQHNVLASLISNIFIAVLLFGLILLYVQIELQDAWCLYPLFLITIYLIYSDLYILYMNKNNKYIINI